MQIIFATKNSGKVREVKMILEDMEADVFTMAEAGIDIEVEEDGETFEENAILKAEAIMQESDCLVLADDSGLEIDYLGGDPGVHSARFMGYDTPYEEKNAKILQMLEGVPEEKRTARFVSVIAAAFPDGRTVTVRGTVEGIIGYEQKGTNGFGYDPIFYIPELGKYSAELSLAEKNEISHRGKALRLMKEKLREMM